MNFIDYNTNSMRIYKKNRNQSETSNYSDFWWWYEIAWTLNNFIESIKRFAVNRNRWIILLLILTTKTKMKAKTMQLAKHRYNIFTLPFIVEFHVILNFHLPSIKYILGMQWMFAEVKGRINVWSSINQIVLNSYQW